MACPLLEKLPPELRKQIYEYLLDFNIVPLRHATQLQPFVKKIAYGARKLPFKFLDLRVKGPTSGWTACDLPSFDDNLIDTGILFTSKLIYTEAIKAFYDLNVFSVDIELFKLGSLCPCVHTCSDLSLAKRLVITFNRSYQKKDNMSYDFNTIDCESFFELVCALFPKLEDLVIRTDGTSRPSTSSLFDIGQSLESCGEIATVTFEKVGSIVARYHSEHFEQEARHFTIRVEYNALADAWECFDNHAVKGYLSGSIALNRSVMKA